MKLIFCPNCQDVIKLQSEEVTQCKCGDSKGHYREDGLYAVINSVAIPLGFSNPSLGLALSKRPENGLGTTFAAFVIPKQCTTIEVDSSYEENYDC